MDVNFSHLLGDIRQPVLVIGPDPDVAGNTLVAALQPAQSVPQANVYDAAVSSPTDTVDGAGKTDQVGAAGSTEDGSQGSTGSPDAAQPGTAAPAGDQPTYTDNGDGTYTRQADGVRGHFTPDGFVASGGEQVDQVSWGS